MVHGGCAASLNYYYGSSLGVNEDDAFVFTLDYELNKQGARDESPEEIISSWKTYPSYRGDRRRGSPSLGTARTTQQAVTGRITFSLRDSEDDSSDLYSECLLLLQFNFALSAFLIRGLRPGQ